MQAAWLSRHCIQTYQKIARESLRASSYAHTGFSMKCSFMDVRGSIDSGTRLCPFDIILRFLVISPMTAAPPMASISNEIIKRCIIS